MTLGDVEQEAWDRGEKVVSLLVVRDRGEQYELTELLRVALTVSGAASSDCLEILDCESFGVVVSFFSFIK